MEKANSQDMDWMLQVMLRMYGRDGNEAENIVEENQMFHGPGFSMERMEEDS